ncbi:MAG: glycosyltransferase, partial [Pseudomonadota bacterium]
RTQTAERVSGLGVSPVIASRIGALATIVSDGVDGLHFAAGDADDLARVAAQAFADRAMLALLGRNARDTWQSDLSPEANMRQLLGIYRQAIAEGACA